MNITKTKLEGVLVFEPIVLSDNRGWFMESYSKKVLSEYGFLIDFEQYNHSYSKKAGTLRGLHFQKLPKAQTKLVRCTKGEILDITVDIRIGSPTYKQWVGIKLSEKNKKQVFIPKGFAHGFITLVDNTEVQYKVDEAYYGRYDRSIRFDDSEFNISWGRDNPILSEKDKNAPSLSDCGANFTYEQR